MFSNVMHFEKILVSIRGKEEEENGRDKEEVEERKYLRERERKVSHLSQLSHTTEHTFVI